MNTIEKIYFGGAFLLGIYFIVKIKMSSGKVMDYLGAYTLYALISVFLVILGMEVLPKVFNMPPSSNVIMMCCVFVAIFFGAVAPVLHKYFIEGHFWDVGIIGFIWAILWFTLLAAFLVTSISVLWVHFNGSATEAVLKGATLNLNTTVFLFLGSFITMFPEIFGSKLHKNP